MHLRIRLGLKVGNEWNKVLEGRCDEGDATVPFADQALYWHKRRGWALIKTRSTNTADSDGFR